MIELEFVRSECGPFNAHIFLLCYSNWRWRNITKDHMVNDEIRVKEVRLIGVDGEQLGVTPIREAMQLATELNLDLVNVAPTAKPPVCRIMDYGKFRYEQQKK